MTAAISTYCTTFGNLRSDGPAGLLKVEYPPPSLCLLRLVARWLSGLKPAHSEYDSYMDFRCLWNWDHVLQNHDQPFSQIALPWRCLNKLRIPVLVARTTSKLPTLQSAGITRPARNLRETIVKMGRIDVYIRANINILRVVGGRAQTLLYSFGDRCWQSVWI